MIIFFRTVHYRKMTAYFIMFMALDATPRHASPEKSPKRKEKNIMLEIQIRLLLGSGLTRLERVGNGSGACAVQSRVYDYNIFLMSLARLTQPNTINVDYAQYIVWRMMIIIISIEAPTREEDEHEDENRFTSAGSLAHYDDTRRRCLLTLLFNSLRILCIYYFSFFFVFLRHHHLCRASAFIVIL